MTAEKGNISIHTENIFPIIKKWLYSDKDIFIRELISNGCDAINKLKSLTMMGEAKVEDNPKYYVKVVYNKTNKTLKFIDNGIGMTDEEVKKYINQVAFSGAEDFISKYKDKMDEKDQIIGHFGLGFYSAFMVSDKVQIDTLSYKEGASSVKWICDGGTEYEIAPSDKKDRGTEITLYINEDSKEFLEEFKIRGIIEKYCSFLPIEIYLEDENAQTEVNEESKDEESKKEEPKPLNDTKPLWRKSPNECTDEEYKDFYKKVFHDYKDPLFWIHLNVDYPFNLKGILYFPKMDNALNTIEGEIKLYNNQVFVANNIKEVIPEFLMLLKGVIDCPDLPLNVSRSFLQNDRSVMKISKHISKKVADKLNELFKNSRDKYNENWEDINVFIKYGCMKEEDFYDKVKDILIYKTTNGEYITLKEYLEKNKENHENKVFYTTDEQQQAQYIKMFKENNIEAIVLNAPIDSHFVSFLEMKESGVKFNRIDSDLSETMKDNKASEGENKEELDSQVNEITTIFKETFDNDKFNVKVEGLKTESIPAVILLDEQSRRMEEMAKMFGGINMNMPSGEESIVVNRNSSLVKSLLELNKKEDRKEDVKLICEHIYDLALMSHKTLDADKMTDFITRSNAILEKLAK
ncbi:molecular chaperone HtpG [Clostridium sp. MB40-C1]|uniref:molecular chaperone HtpG n=1 Tax=Clostridium sp. MB40-C1 TaxID=3070996 RepID=UPI0027E1BA44|nr:molecular chaperone HtpG [Clostridium sp. MB40-C1]WMJ79314.1 molecular chaperone HtpG [Clostridium sp. MB40-C1]